MKKQISLLALAAVIGMAMFSCQKEAAPKQDGPITDDVLASIAKAGFSTENVIREGSGYIVEGDIYIDDNHFRSNPGWKTLTIAETEQYRTTNLVTRLPRNITVSVSSKMPAAYQGVGGYVDSAIKRYNDQNLTVTFTLVSSGGNINIVNANGNYLASAGFPTAGGDPYNTVNVNTRSLNGQARGTIISVIAHEMGHCIGFRHTDYFNRSLSCGGSPTNEGDGGVGAIYIPGTATGFDAGSWMLSCISSNADRPFNANDVIALNYLY